MIWKMTQRNIQVYVRNRTAVFFSFLSVFIIIGLYALFLGKMQVDSIAGMMKQFGMADTGVRFLVDSWIMSGLLSVSAVTISLGALDTMVFDVEQKRFSDFIVAPVSRASVVLSYLISSCIISFMFNLVTLAIGELYILSGGGELLSLAKLLEVLGILALSVFASSSILFLVISFIKSGTAFGTLSTLLGTLIGFLTGVYVPLGILPDAVQKFVLFVPFTHSAGLLRQVFCERPLEAVFGAIPEHARADVISQYKGMYGIQLHWGDFNITIPLMLIVLAGTAVLFLLLSALKLRRYRQA